MITRFTSKMKTLLFLFTESAPLFNFKIDLNAKIANKNKTS